jgi:hypothetical protein
MYLAVAAHAGAFFHDDEIGDPAAAAYAALQTARE